jgi:hypothetical protein
MTRATSFALSSYVSCSGSARESRKWGDASPWPPSRRASHDWNALSSAWHALVLAWSNVGAYLLGCRESPKEPERCVPTRNCDFSPPWRWRRPPRADAEVNRRRPLPKLRRLLRSPRPSPRRPRATTELARVNTRCQTARRCRGIITVIPAPPRNDPESLSYEKRGTTASAFSSRSLAPRLADLVMRRRCMLQRVPATRIAVLLTAWLGASCAPSVPARPPVTSPLSTKAVESPAPRIATSLTRDPIAESPPEATPGAHSGHGHGEHGHPNSRPSTPVAPRDTHEHDSSPGTSNRPSPAPSTSDHEHDSGQAR